MDSTKLLILEDSEDDAFLLQATLETAVLHFDVKVVSTAEEFIEALDTFAPAIILSDHQLHQFSSVEALQITRKKLPHVPFILVTGAVSEEFAANILKSGADDYILKDRLTRLPSAIEAALKQRQLEKEKQEAAEKLVQSEEKYRNIFFKSPLPKWVYDYETLRFLEVNEAAIRHYGYTQEEFLSMTIKDIRPKEDVQLLLDDLTKIEWVESDSRKGISRHMKKNGEPIIVETTAHFIDYYNKKARMVVVNDITERKKSEEALRKSEMRLNEAQAITHISNWEVDLLQNIFTCSNEFYSIYGLHKGEVQPSTELFLSFMHPDDAGFAKKKMQEAFTSFSDSALNFRFIRNDGLTRYGYTEWRFQFDKQGKATGLFGILQDITERKQAEENLKLLETEIFEQKIHEQKKIARAIIKASEKERNHLGQELHDNINQILASARLYLGSAGNKNAQLEKLITYPIELIDSSIEEIRLLCHKLVTPLKNIDLEGLVQLLFSNLSNSTSMQTDFTYSVSNEFLSDDLKLNIYRIIQEQVNNIVKYAGAERVNISIKTSDKTINIIVEDDGKGFDVSTKRKGIGISNIINRIGSYNGKVEIKSSPGNGCKLQISIPL